MAGSASSAAEENCNWLEQNIVALNCELPRDTIVATIGSIEKELTSFVDSVENRFSAASLLSEDGLTANVTYAIKFLNDLKVKFMDHVTQFLDDRINQDQLSLLQFKKRLLDSVTTCRASVEQFRNVYDNEARQREKISMEHFRLQTMRQYQEETRSLNKTLAERTSENVILSKQLEFLMIQRESLQSRLVIAHQMFRAVCCSFTIYRWF